MKYLEQQHLIKSLENKKFSLNKKYTNTQFSWRTGYNQAIDDAIYLISHQRTIVETDQTGKS